MYSIEELRRLCEPKNMVVTQHSRKRFEERGIKISDICSAISHGEIIEQYPNDYPFLSCLVLGTNGTSVLHTVVSVSDQFMYIITAYYPDPDKWENDWKTRKGETK